MAAAVLGTTPFAWHAASTASGIAAIAVVGLSLLRRAFTQPRRTTPSDAAERARRIRERRSRR